MRAKLLASGMDVVCGGLTGGSRAAEVEGVRKRVEVFAGDVPADRLAFDLTPGFKSFSLAVEAVAPAGSWLLYCRHEQMGADNRVWPGTERYDYWRK